MNTDTFFKHYGIRENPFRAEEARQDAVFYRVETACYHPDYPKMRGEFDRPSSAIVFGERGSGKTAIRLQIERDIAEYNGGNPQQRCLQVAYDDLNPMLDRFHQHHGGGPADEVLAKLRVVDHMDAVLNTVVPGIVDQVLGDQRTEQVIETETPLNKAMRQIEPAMKRDLLLLQVCYDRPEEADMRTGPLRQAIRSSSRSTLPLLKWSAIVSLVVSLAVLIGYLLTSPEEQRWLWTLGIIILLGVTAGLGGRWLWQWWKVHRVARGLSRSLAVMNRSADSFQRSLTALRVDDVLMSELPDQAGDDPRFLMMQRLLRVIRPLGYRSVVVLFDRVDEPTLVNGEPSRMKSVVWPMLSNKFLQQDRFGIKMLLPLDLKHLLFRETTDFFREARLDKQNLVERLTWSGAMLYDLCTARLNACRGGQNESMSLTELFDESVTNQDIVDALDQMQQPRDAFKLLYQTIQEHCANTPEEQPVWQIPKLTLDTVRKQQVERISGMLRGTRPA